ncbi:hypothetical protein CPB83DRAFT_947899 [Crepidotus variabilis]|uniref:Uncharacterized protein n=1 Tax=Crepidotus variabilis TaxID=179855 RepID=A0A9P6EP30_9AGAR|nr:hypothetical protein CPB83DRAFT_947899 [Crepidotus variabilis]
MASQYPSHTSPFLAFTPPSHISAMAPPFHYLIIACKGHAEPIGKSKIGQYETRVAVRSKKKRGSPLKLDECFHGIFLVRSVLMRRLFLAPPKLWLRYVDEWRNGRWMEVDVDGGWMGEDQRRRELHDRGLTVVRYQHSVLPLRIESNENEKVVKLKFGRDSRRSSKSSLHQMIGLQVPAVHRNGSQLFIVFAFPPPAFALPPSTESSPHPSPPPLPLHSVPSLSHSLLSHLQLSLNNENFSGMRGRPKRAVATLAPKTVEYVPALRYPNACLLSLLDSSWNIDPVMPTPNIKRDADVAGSPAGKDQAASPSTLKL